jgi:hypothetical protein
MHPTFWFTTGSVQRSISCRMSYLFILFHRMPSATETGIPAKVARYESKATIDMTCVLAILPTVDLQRARPRPRLRIYSSRDTTSSFTGLDC